VELLEVRELNIELEATVLFDSLLREDANTSATQVREVWTFIKSVHHYMIHFIIGIS
jgi:hypothetical protein